MWGWFDSGDVGNAEIWWSWRKVRLQEQVTKKTRWAFGSDVWCYAFVVQWYETDGREEDNNVMRLFCGCINKSYTARHHKDEVKNKRSFWLPHKITSSVHIVLLLTCTPNLVQNIILCKFFLSVQLVGYFICCCLNRAYTGKWVSLYDNNSSKSYWLHLASSNYPI